METKFKIRMEPEYLDTNQTLEATIGDPTNKYLEVGECPRVELKTNTFNGYLLNYLNEKEILERIEFLKLVHSEMDLRRKKTNKPVKKKTAKKKTTRKKGK